MIMGAVQQCSAYDPDPRPSPDPIARSFVQKQLLYLLFSLDLFTFCMDIILVLSRESRRLLYSNCKEHSKASQIASFAEVNFYSWCTARHRSLIL